MSNASAGDTLILMDGTYTETLNPTIAGVNIEALNDGAVLFDGEGARQPVTISVDNVTIKGINACNSNASVYTVTGDGASLLRCVGWDAADNGNNHIFAVSKGTDILLEDCAGFGVARKIFSISSFASYVTCRRCFGIWQGLTGDNGPTMTFTVGYKTYHCVYDHCIAMWNLSEFETLPAQPYGCFALDGYGEEDRDTYNELRNSIAFVRATDAYSPDQAVFVDGCDHFTIDNVVAYIGDTPSEPVQTVILGNAQPTDINNVANKFTVIGPRPNSGIGDDADPGYWTNTNILVSDTLANAYDGETVWNATSGAQLDSAVFLAWPMRQRIIDTLGMDVVAELIAVFGT